MVEIFHEIEGALKNAFLHIVGNFLEDEDFYSKEVPDRCRYTHDWVELNRIWEGFQKRVFLVWRSGPDIERVIKYAFDSTEIEKAAREWIVPVLWDVWDDFDDNMALEGRMENKIRWTGQTYFIIEMLKWMNEVHPSLVLMAEDDFDVAESVRQEEAKMESWKQKVDADVHAGEQWHEDLMERLNQGGE